MPPISTVDDEIAWLCRQADRNPAWGPLLTAAVEHRARMRELERQRVAEETQHRQRRAAWAELRARTKTALQDPALTAAERSLLVSRALVEARDLTLAQGGAAADPLTDLSDLHAHRLTAAGVLADAQAGPDARSAAGEVLTGIEQRITDSTPAARAYARTGARPTQED